MDAGAWEIENALKELAKVKDQVKTIKERATEVRHDKCLVHRHEAAGRAATDRWACC
jgi:hypothetical protein